MKILLVHERYRERGGEDTAVDAEARLLAAAGHDVSQFGRDNAVIDESSGLAGRARLAAGTVWCSAARRELGEVVMRERPDVVHVHNTFPLLSPAIYGVARRRGTRIVQTLHNYRLVCPQAQLFREGRPCQDCVGGALPWPGVVHGCYRGSRSQSAVVASMLVLHRTLATWRRHVDRFLVPSAYASGVLVAGGLEVERISVVPNVVEDPVPAAGGSVREDPVVFVGRLSAEKGVDVLLSAWQRAWEPGCPDLVVVGDGPERSALEQWALIHGLRGVRFVGAASPAEVRSWLGGASMAVVPSLWPETFGLVAAEAQAAGVAVLASDIGALPELVEAGRTGRLARPGDAADWEANLRWAFTHPEELATMGAAARANWQARWSPEAWLPALIDAFGV